MIKIYRIIKFFIIYRKNIIKNYKYLYTKYGFIINFYCELSTTIILDDAPEELKTKYGDALIKLELKKLEDQLYNDFNKLELNELIKLYEIKKIDTFKYGITYGYNFFNNRKLIKLIIFSILFIILSLALIIII